MKRNVLVILISTLSIHLSIGQLNQRVYFNKDMKKVEQDSATFYRITTVHPNDNSKFLQNTFYMSQKIKSAVACLDDACAKMDGVYISYYENGNKELAYNYQNGNKTNTTKWYANGQIQEISLQTLEPNLDFYNWDQLSSYWSESGEQWVENGNGKVTYFHEDTTSISSIGEYKDGYKIGLWKGFHKSGKNYYEETYGKNNVKGTSWDEDGNAFEYDQMQSQPTPTKSMQGFYQFIGKDMTYPNYARRHGIEGKVFVQFVVDTTGELIEVKVVKGIGGGCDEEAERVIKNAPPWQPGLLRGQPAKITMILPITFKLS